MIVSPKWAEATQRLWYCNFSLPIHNDISQDGDSIFLCSQARRDNREVITLHTAGYHHPESLHLCAGAGWCQSVSWISSERSLQPAEALWKLWPETWARSCGSGWCHCDISTFSPWRGTFYGHVAPVVALLWNAHWLKSSHAGLGSPGLPRESGALLLHSLQRTDVRQGKYQREAIVWTWIPQISADHFVAWNNSWTLTHFSAPCASHACVCFPHYIVECYIKYANGPGTAERWESQMASGRWKLQPNADWSPLDPPTDDWGAIGDQSNCSHSTHTVTHPSHCPVPPLLFK